MAEIDIAAVFHLLGDVAQGVRTLQGDVRGLQGDVRGLQVDMAAVKQDVRTLQHDVASVRQTLTEYHASVLGHGMLISEMEDRIRRIERHLNLPSPAAQ